MDDQEQGVPLESDENEGGFDGPPVDFSSDSDVDSPSYELPSQQILDQEIDGANPCTINAGSDSSDLPQGAGASQAQSSAADPVSTLLRAMGQRVPELYRETSSSGTPERTAGQELAKTTPQVFPQGRRPAGSSDESGTPAVPLVLRTPVPPTSPRTDNPNAGSTAPVLSEARRQTTGGERAPIITPDVSAIRSSGATTVINPSVDRVDPSIALRQTSAVTATRSQDATVAIRPTSEITSGKDQGSASAVKSMQAFSRVDGPATEGLVRSTSVPTERLQAAVVSPNTPGAPVALVKPDVAREGVVGSSLNGASGTHADTATLLPRRTGMDLPTSIQEVTTRGAALTSFVPARSLRTDEFTISGTIDKPISRFTIGRTGDFLASQDSPIQRNQFLTTERVLQSQTRVPNTEPTLLSVVRPLSTLSSSGATDALRETQAPTRLLGATPVGLIEASLLGATEKSFTRALTAQLMMSESVALSTNKYLKQEQIARIELAHIRIEKAPVQYASLATINPSFAAIVARELIAANAKHQQDVPNKPGTHTTHTTHTDRPDIRISLAHALSDNSTRKHIANAPVSRELSSDVVKGNPFNPLIHGPTATGRRPTDLAVSAGETNTATGKDFTLTNIKTVGNSIVLRELCMCSGSQKCSICSSADAAVAPQDARTVATHNMVALELALVALVAVAAVAKEKEKEKEKEEAKEDDNEHDENGNAALTAARQTYVVKQGDTLNSIAEHHFGDAKVAILIADLNKGRTRQSHADGKLIVEIFEDTAIDLPMWNELRAAYKEGRLDNAPKVVTIVMRSPLMSAVDHTALNHLAAVITSGGVSKPGPELATLS